MKIELCVKKKKKKNHKTINKSCRKNLNRVQTSLVKYSESCKKPVETETLALHLKQMIMRFILISNVCNFSLGQRQKARLKDIFDC